MPHIDERSILALWAGLYPAQGDALLHLLVCDECQRKGQEVLVPEMQQQGPRQDPRASPGLLFRNLQDALQTRFTEEAQEEEAAGPLFDRLLRLPLDERKTAIERNEEYHSPFVALRLLGLAGTSVQSAPILAELLIGLALTIARALEEQGRDLEAGRLRARGWCVRAEAHRLRGALGECWVALGGADRALETQQLELSERGVYCRTLARLRKDQDRVDEALALLDRAAALFAQAADFAEMGETLADRGWLLLDELDAESAVVPLHAALTLVDTRERPQLVLRVRHGLALCYADLGRGAEAEDLLKDSRELFERLPLGRPRLKSAEADVQARIGAVARAAELLQTAIRGYLAEGAAFDAGIAGLELARLSLEAGGFEDLDRVRPELDLLGRVLPPAASEVFQEALAAALAGGSGAPEQLETASKLLSHMRYEVDLSFGEGEPS